MIMEIFLLFIALGFVLTVVGYYVNENLLIIIGFLIFGLISLPLLQQDLEYKSGSFVNSSYTYADDKIDSTSNTIIYEYTTYTGTVTYGLFFLLLSLSGLFMWYKGYRGKKKDEDD